jgi:hypothetical protein
MAKIRLALFAFLLIGAIVCAAGAVGQERPDATFSSTIQILKVHWQKQIRLPNNYDPAIIPTRGVFVDPASKTATSLPGTGIDATRPPSSNPNTSIDSNVFFPTTPRRLPIYYLYSLKIKNVGAKRIDGVAWTYSFLDRETKAELGRHEFLSYRKIAPDAVGIFENPLRSPPVRVVKTSDSGSPQRPMSEQATVQCILFADETTWRNANASAEVCRLLAEGNAAKRKPATASRQN